MPQLNTLHPLIERMAAYGERQALVTFRMQGAEHLNYADLAAAARGLVDGMIARGFGSGDFVAIFSGNRREWVIAALAVLGSGAVLVPLDVQLSDVPLRHILRDSGARLVFTTSDQMKRLQDLGFSPDTDIVLLDGEAGDRRGWRAWLGNSGGEQESGRPDNTAVLFYTSGTTGPPKGVPLTHGNLVFEINSVLGTDLVAESTGLLLPLPLHHVFPFVVGLLTPLAAGLPIVFPQALTGPQILRALNESRVSTMIGVPGLYAALYAGIETQIRARSPLAGLAFHAWVSTNSWLRRRFGLQTGERLMRPLRARVSPTLTTLACGGAKLDSRLAWNLESLGWRVLTGYGLTETSPILTVNTHRKARIGSQGKPIAGIDIRIDPSAVSGDASASAEEPAVRPGVRGEILSRGPNVFAGYRGLPEENRRAFSKDGWFRTGDLGYFDSDGFLYVTGRISTVIVTASGKNIQPDEVEEAYQQHPLIKEIGIFAEGGKLVAIVIPELEEINRRGYHDSAAGVCDAVREQSRKLPSYQRIGDFVVSRDALARTRLGKIQRHLLAERFRTEKRGANKVQRPRTPISLEEMSSDDRLLLDNPVARKTWEWLTRRFATQRLTPDSNPQLDLGIDSLAWVELTFDIRQQVGVELKEKTVQRIGTVRDLLEEVAQASEATEEANRLLALERPESVLNRTEESWLEPLGPFLFVLARWLFRLNRVIMKTFFRLVIEGREHLPACGPAVLVPNHCSYLDAPALAAALHIHNPRLLDMTYWAGAADVMFVTPVRRFSSRLTRIVPIDPERAAASSLAFGASILRKENILVWFPEGRLSLTGRLGPFRPGLGLLVKYLKVPVVPVYIRGTFAALPSGKWWPRREAISVAFGKPVRALDLEREGTQGDAPERIVEALHDLVAKLGEQA